MKVTTRQLRRIIREVVKGPQGLVKEAPRKPVDAKKAALQMLEPLMKLTVADKHGYVVPKDNKIKSPVTLSISTYGTGGTEPAHFEVTSYGNGVNKHRETPGNAAYRAALSALWNVVYPGGEGVLTVVDAIKMWPSIEELLCTANEEKTELDKVKVIPQETLAQKKYMDHSHRDEDQFIKAASEYLLMKDMGQEPWNVDRDAFISEFISMSDNEEEGEQAYYDALKDYALQAQDAIMTLVNNDEPATMRNLEKYLKGKKPQHRG